MSDYVAFEAPAWLWILSCVVLLVAGIAFGALAAYALRIARALDRIDDYEHLALTRSDAQREFAAMDERLKKLERPEPIPLRIERAPDTTRDEGPLELPAHSDTLPSGPWVTYADS